MERRKNLRQYLHSTFLKRYICFANARYAKHFNISKKIIIIFGAGNLALGHIKSFDIFDSYLWNFKFWIHMKSTILYSIQIYRMIWSQRWHELCARKSIRNRRNGTVKRNIFRIMKSGSPKTKCFFRLDKFIFEFEYYQKCCRSEVVAGQRFIIKYLHSFNKNSRNLFSEFESIHEK